MEFSQSRLRAAIWWLSPVVAAWVVLVTLAHQTTQWAISWTQNLFGWTLLLSYVCLWGAVVAASRNSRLMLIRAIAANLTLAAVILCLEVAAGLKLVHWRLVFERMAGEGSEYITSFRLDPELGFGRPPDARWSGRPPSDIERGFSMPASLSEPISFSYDQWGYRNANRRDDADVVLIGDSYVEGAYVSDHQTVAARLQEQLGKPVANLGIAGYGSLHELIVLKKHAPRYKPRVVVWFLFEGNDFYDDHDFENAQLAQPAAAGAQLDQSQAIVAAQGWRKRSFTRALLHRLRLWGEPLLPAQAPYFGQLSSSSGSADKVYFADYAAVPWSDWLLGRWETTLATLQQAQAVAKQEGLQIVFCLIPIKFRVYQPFIEYSRRGPMGSWTTWPLPELFARACQSSGLVCLDLTGTLQDAVRNGGMPYAAVDTHWSAEGNDLVAALLAGELCGRGWLDGCGGELGGRSERSDMPQ